jgi:hypothetical protein
VKESKEEVKRKSKNLPDLPDLLVQGLVFSVALSRRIGCIAAAVRVRGAGKRG